MQVKEHVTQEVKKIATEGKAVESKIIEFVKADFRQTLADCDKTGHSVKQATTDTLEGVEVGLKAAGHKTGHIVSQSAEAIANLNQEIVEKSLNVARTSADKAKEVLDQAVEKSSGDLEKVEAKTKTAMEKAHAILSEKTEAGKAKLSGVSSGIKEYAASKKNEWDQSAHDALNKVAEASSSHMNQMKNSSKEHRDQLLYHGRVRVSEWLGKLKDKVDPSA